MKKNESEYSFAKDAYDFIKEISINSLIQKDTIFYKKKENIIWTCKSCESDYEMSFYDKVYRGRGKNGCKKCSLKNRGLKYSESRANTINLTDIKPDIYQYLREDNEVDPKNYPKTSPVKLKLTCSMKHDFEMSIGGVSNGNWCQKCAYIKRGATNKNNFELFNGRILLANKKIVEDYSINNIKKIEDIKIKSEYFLLTCNKCNSDYKTNYARIMDGRGCPFCSYTIFKRGVNDVATLYPEFTDLFDKDYENDLSLYSAADLKRKYKKFPLKCLKCNYKYFTSSINSIKVCPSCEGRSKMELELLEYIKSIYSGAIYESDRTLIKPYEIDIYLPELKVAFEFNGDYWHSSEVISSNSNFTDAYEYHMNKIILCGEVEVELFFVWESDWVNKNETIKKEIYRALMHASYSSDILRKIVGILG